MKILDPENPQRLSRSEFRVCLMLSTGLQVDGISQKLGLTRPTVRTHLRAILAKTGLTSVADLVCELAQGQSPFVNAGPGKPVKLARHTATDGHRTVHRGMAG